MLSHLRLFQSGHVRLGYACLCLLLLLFSQQSFAQDLPAPISTNRSASVDLLEAQSNANRKALLNQARQLEDFLQLIRNNRDSLYSHRDELRVVDSLERILQLLELGSASMGEDLEKLKDGVITENRNYLNRFWVMLAAVLVFFMQAGFKAFEVGMVRPQHSALVGMKNLLDWLVLSGAFFLLGFGFMFGESNGLFGTSLFLPSFEDMNAVGVDYGMEFFLYQLAFAGTAATIVSGAMSERTILLSYVLISLFVGLLVYPLFGHWAWGNIYIPENTAWLADMGFMDFAGSTVVHSVGAWVALIGAWMIGPRTGRFNADGTVNKTGFSSGNLGYAVLGVFILWFGWWGFNGGSTLEYNDSVATIVLNTNLAGAFGGLVAFLDAFFRDRDNTYEKMLGGVLGGLVAITACCNVVSPLESILIGMLAGYVQNVGVDLLLKWKIDDPVGAVPVHGFCGVIGTLCVGIFGDPYLFSANQDEILSQANALAASRGVDVASIPLSDISIDLLPFGVFRQTMVQLVGIIVAFVLVTVLSYLFFRLLRKVLGLRISTDQEMDGYI